MQAGKERGVAASAGGEEAMAWLSGGVLLSWMATKSLFVYGDGTCVACPNADQASPELQSTAADELRPQQRQAPNDLPGEEARPI
jgi:hypothetical protein